MEHSHVRKKVSQTTVVDIKLARQSDRVGEGMQRWRREFPDIDCSGKGIVGRILHLQEHFLTAINQSLAKHKLKYPAFAVLATLRVEGAPYQMSPKALLDTLILTSGGLSNILRKLEARGLLRRLQDDKDGRGVIVELTERGRRLVEPAMREHAAVERKLIKVLDHAEEKVAAELLEELVLSLNLIRQTPP